MAMLTTVVGGLLAGAGTSLFILRGGQINGISGIVYGAVTPARPESWLWRAVYMAGLLSVGLAIQHFFPGVASIGAPSGSLLTVACAGYLVGLGTVASNGCTSGHGLCGLSRLSKRSLVATMTFFGVGMATANLLDARTGPVLPATAAVVALFVALRTRLSRESRQGAPTLSKAPAWWAWSSSASLAKPPTATSESLVQQASHVRQLGVTLASAVLFGSGLLIGGMVDPHVVKGFLVLNESWNPRMGIFFATALASSFVGYRLAVDREIECALPPAGPAARITPSLVFGAAMFGMGWGLQGVCPGPAIVGLAAPSLSSLVYWVGLVGGMYTFYAMERLLPVQPKAAALRTKSTLRL